MSIHPTAVIDPAVEVDASAEIGAYAIVEENVRIGPETRLWPHAYVSAGTTLGRGCQIHPFAVVGHLPQDLKFAGEPTYTAIGDGTIVREHATIHRGTMPGSTTVVGQRCFIMSTGHIGHNCVIGDDVIVANGGLLAGHCEVGNRAFISGNVAVHQFCRIGAFVMLGGRVSAVASDVPPFMLVEPPGVVGLNVVGLRRAGISSEARRELRRCHQILYRGTGAFPRRIEEIAGLVRTDAGRTLAKFLQAPSKRGYLRLRRDATSAADSEAS